MRISLAALMLFCAAAASSAQDAVTGAEFGAYARGWTLHFEQDGAPFGVESFDAGDGVVWRPEGGRCARGVWGADGPRICFFYPGVAACWRMFRDADGLFAEAEDDPNFILRIVRRDRSPVLCDDGPQA
ncbi:MAG: hypothetical protein ACFCUS_01045 [Rubrimonas sp.]|uniref:hypothetical protein n=1 Tax=Rubrimonas sp. TaxID=2036015 RepID=UPI002FDDF604